MKNTIINTKAFREDAFTLKHQMNDAIFFIKSEASKLFVKAERGIRMREYANGDREAVAVLISGGEDKRVEYDLMLTALRRAEKLTPFEVYAVNPSSHKLEDVEKILSRPTMDAMIYLAPKAEQLHKEVA